MNEFDAAMREAHEGGYHDIRDEETDACDQCSADRERLARDFAVELAWINVYELFQNYGGAEEGGWWYISGNLALSIQVVAKHIDIETTKAALEVAFPEKGTWTTRDGREIPVSYYESLYEGGAYSVMVEQHPGESFPQERPHYE